MIARALGGMALVASMVVAAPGGFQNAAAEDTRVLASVSSAAPDPATRLEKAIEDATRRQVPGAAGSGWVLHTLERSEAALGGREFVVATGVITTAGAPDTQIRLSGHYDPESGTLERVSYRLQGAKPSIAAPTDTSWSVQQAVQHAFSEVLPDEQVLFALDTAQATRVEGGGRRFEGSGIGRWGEGDARFVAFTLTLSRYGELVEFDYSARSSGAEADYVAGY